MHITGLEPCWAPQHSVLAVVIIVIVLSGLLHDIIHCLIIHCLAQETNLGIVHNW